MKVHGQAGRRRSPEYAAWAHMLERCSNPKCKNYPRYGGRGIRVCEAWRDFVVFLSDVGPRPSREHSLDRINNDGDYEPNNVRWATEAQQQQNKPGVIKIVYGSEVLPIRDWAKRIGCDPNTLLMRACSGWSAKRILTTPIRSYRRRHAQAASR